MEELGEEYFDELLSRSFFQKSLYWISFVMHDLNNDLARDVSGNFCLSLERSKTRQLSEKVHHFSYSQSIHDNYHKLEPTQHAKYLRTFLPMRNPYSRYHCLSISIIRDLLPKLSCIRVLSLSFYANVDELPDSICTLMHLRYLDLSHTSIKSLPDTICQLYNLQTLNLSYCHHLIKLPANLGELVNLRHLDIEGTLLDKLPPQIEKLESLQTLSTFIVEEDNSSWIGELNGLRHLKGTLSIRGLHNVKNVEDVIEVNLKEKTGIKELVFVWGEGTKVSNDHCIVLDKLQPSVKLSDLTLDNYGGIRFSNWLQDGSLSNLTSLHFYNCTKCLSLPSLGQLPSLEKLFLIDMKSVRQVDSCFYGNGPSSVKPFQKLKFLMFRSMPEWEEWSPSGCGDNDDFPKLEKLWLQDCPKLCGNLPKLLPSLREVWITTCGELTVVIQGDASPRELLLEGCKNVVFENSSNLSSLIELVIDIESDYLPNGMLEDCSNLEKLKISNSPSLTHFPDEGLPTTLKELDISSCNNLQFLPVQYKHLSSLGLQNSSCDSIASFPLGLFPNLKNLNIISLKNLESFSIEDEDHENLKFLQTLRIEECNKLVSFPRGGLRTASLVSLDIWQCQNLKSWPEAMNTQLTSLQSLYIFSCEEVESFPAGGLPSSLRHLCIIVVQCKKLMAEMRECNLHTLSSLKSLSIGGCEEIESFPEWQLPTSITRLSLSRLPNLNTLDVGRLTSLQTLQIWDCPKVKFNSKLRNAQDMPASFVRLSINGCLVMAKQLQMRNMDLIPDLTIDNGRFTFSWDVADTRVPRFKYLLDYFFPPHPAARVDYRAGIIGLYALWRVLISKSQVE